jgi:hypothetical protein
MTALFVVIMVEQWMEKRNRPSVLIGLGFGLACLLIFGADNFILPTMICVMVVLVVGRSRLEQPDEPEKPEQPDGQKLDEPKQPKKPDGQKLDEPEKPKKPDGQNERKGGDADAR